MENQLSPKIDKIAYTVDKIDELVRRRDSLNLKIAELQDSMVEMKPDVRAELSIEKKRRIGKNVLAFVAENYPNDSQHCIEFKNYADNFEEDK